IIVIAHRGAIAIAERGAVETRFGGYVFECSIAFVAEQAVVKGRIGLLELRQFGSVGEEDIHLPVLVEIQDADPAAHWLLEVFSTGVVVIGDVRDLRSWRDVREVRTRTGCGQQEYGGDRSPYEVGQALSHVFPTRSDLSRHPPSV